MNNPISIRLANEQKEILDTLASQHNIARSDVIKSMIDLYVEVKIKGGSPDLQPHLINDPTIAAIYSYVNAAIERLDKRIDSLGTLPSHAAPAIEYTWHDFDDRCSDGYHELSRDDREQIRLDVGRDNFATLDIGIQFDIYHEHKQSGLIISHDDYFDYLMPQTEKGFSEPNGDKWPTMTQQQIEAIALDIELPTKEVPWQVLAEMKAEQEAIKAAKDARMDEWFN